MIQELREVFTDEFLLGLGAMWMSGLLIASIIFAFAMERL